MAYSLTSNYNHEYAEIFFFKIIVIFLLSILMWRFFLIINRNVPHVNIIVPPINTATDSQHENVSSLKINNIRDRNEDKGAITFLNRLLRLPPHHRPTPIIPKNTTITQQHDGILPYDLTHACNYEHIFDKKKLQSCRKDRALVFARLFRGTSFRIPPIRGSQIVLSVPEEEVGCQLLTRTLYLLGTYYNLFLLVGMKLLIYPHNTETLRYKHELNYMDRIIQKLRCNRYTKEMCRNKILKETEIQSNVLPIEVLPSHRIIANSSVIGRVAFVRQLPQKPEFVLEYSKEVKIELEKFGFKVILYNKIDSENFGISGIGKDLLL